MGILDEMKEIGDLIKKAGDIELYRRINKLEGEVIDLTRDKRRSEEKLEELERTLKFKEKLTFREPFYWLEKDQTPYCPGCWEDKHKAVHVIFAFDNARDARFDCPTCGHMYMVKSVKWRNLQNEHR